MPILLAILLTLLNALWLALVVFGLPGNWLMVATTAALAWWQWDEAKPASDQMFSVTMLIILAALAAAGEIAELLAGLVGSKTAGGTKWGAAGALAGTIIGAIAGTVMIPIPVLGSILGACGGAALGAALLEIKGGMHLEGALRSGAGAGAGRLVGTLAKLACGVAIWLLSAVAAFWP